MNDIPTNSSHTLNSLTVVTPFYNEEANVLAFYAELCNQLDPALVKWDMVFVDDGSRDRTLELLNQLADQDRRITVLSLSRNFGHQIALTAGLDHTSGDVVVVLDSDLQHPPSVILKMIKQYENGFDIVYGIRRDDKSLGILKRLTTFGFYSLFKRMTTVEVFNGAADFRLMGRPVVQALKAMREQHRYLRGMVPWLGFSFTTVLYDQPKRFAGQPVYTWRKSLKLARHAFFSFSTIPLDLITIMGIGMTMLAMAYLVYALVIGILGYAVDGWTSLLVAMLAIGGVQMVSLGVIAQYIGMIFEQVKQRPLYVIKQLRLASDRTQEESTREKTFDYEHTQ